MKESPHITAEQDKRETVICIVYASVIVFGMLALMLHGMAFLSWTEPTMEEIYRNKRMGNEIEVLRYEINYLKNHVHPETNKGFTQGLLYY